MYKIKSSRTKSLALLSIFPLAWTLTTFLVSEGNITMNLCFGLIFTWSLGTLLVRSSWMPEIIIDKRRVGG